MAPDETAANVQKISLPSAWRKDGGPAIHTGGYGNFIKYAQVTPTEIELLGIFAPMTPPAKLNVSRLTTGTDVIAPVSDKNKQ